MRTGLAEGFAGALLIWQGNEELRQLLLRWRRIVAWRREEKGGKVFYCFFSLWANQMERRGEGEERVSE